MNLHKNTKDFNDAIQATAAHLNLPDVFVEKDYWVSFILYRLHILENSNKFVFKGGTSLSKAYGLIERFSEDVDLALTDVGNLSGNQIKALIDKTSKKLTEDPLSNVDNDSRTSKGSRFRRTVHSYPKLTLSGDYGAASPNLLLEINSFAEPEPAAPKTIQSFIGTFFSEKYPDSLTTYGLQPFEIIVLGLKRTYIEKILSLTRHSYSEDESIREKIRHLYDISKLEFASDIVDFKDDSKAVRSLFDIVIETDKLNAEFAGDWIEKDQKLAPLFTDKIIKSAMKEAYESTLFRSLIWNLDTMPKFEDAWKSIETFKTYL